MLAPSNLAPVRSTSAKIAVERGAAEDHVGALGGVEGGALERHTERGVGARDPVEADVRAVGAVERGVVEVGADRVHAVERGVAQVGAAEVGVGGEVAEVGVAEVGAEKFEAWAEPPDRSPRVHVRAIAVGMDDAIADLR